ncbi:MAG: protein kinase [Gemmatales bacterium]|nr:protein kinase [Gemmatales bacterium]MDW7994027.1 protein kinase [Gemmatales bacterium]
MPSAATELKQIGPYEILALIAEGGMGTVYRARHRESGELVAVKVFPAAMASNLVLLQRFEQEFRAASRLTHPNIVRALEFGRDGKVPYIVMELVEGESLGQRVERLGRLPEAEAVAYIVQVAQGLHQAHRQGIIHRDVKPDNILVDPHGQAKLADLGLVKDLDADLNLTRTGRGLGTPHFMAPEQFRNAKHADVRCDVYALGATLYMLVTGQLPFRGCSPLDAWIRKIHNDLPSPRQLRAELSERVDWAIRRAMSADPDKRPADCREFVEDLLGHRIREAGPFFEPIETPQGDWFVRYATLEGHLVTRKGPLAVIRRALQGGKCGQLERVQVAVHADGPFGPLQEFPELRDLVIQPGVLSLPRMSSRPTHAPAAGTEMSGQQILSRHSALSSAVRSSVQPIATGSGAATAMGTLNAAIEVSSTRTEKPTATLPAHQSAKPSADLALKAPNRVKRPENARSSQTDWLSWLAVLIFVLIGFFLGWFLIR